MMKEASFRTVLKEDKSGVTFVFGDEKHGVTLNAEKLSALLDSLGHMRAEISPKINMRKPPTAAFLSVMVEHWAFAEDHPPRSPQDVILVLAHPGFGWISYRMTLRAAQGLARDLTNEIERKSPRKPKSH